VKLKRVYFVCRQCAVGGFPADDVLGVTGGRTAQAQRLLCLAGGSWSFDRAAHLLKEFCGLRVSDNTIRAVCHERAGQMADWQHTDPAAHARFHQAAGEVEFETDGTCVNTQEGWREVRLGLFAKRQRGQPASPDKWDQRDLPPPTQVVAWAAIERGARFVSRWSRWLGRLKVGRKTPVHVVADGAAWIWQGVCDRLPQAEGVLDIFHALEHLAATARVLHGEGTEVAAAWRNEARRRLLADGWQGIEVWLAAQYRGQRKRTKREALQELMDYLRRQRDHLDYRRQLEQGRTIGSGMVEGACKHMIGRRLKQTGARWRVRRANRMATLCCTLHTDAWKTYWNQAA
jgi:hypothetical protein